MAIEHAIRLEHVSKAYRHYDKPLDRLRELVGRRKLHVERTSVSDVSLSIPRGEVVGIIGRNGAGKSTLLKMIAGRLEASAGRVSVTGSIAAILELGTGFHPDLSGRENVRVGGLCLGLTKREIEKEMQNIIDFSELGDVIDMPFRTYSSGMQARLTFATAVTVNPDILIIDEALSVGDNKFQLKSFNRIRKFKEEGKTIIVVTHGMGSVTSFCDRAILLDRGRILADGDPNWVTSVYHHLQFGDLDPASLTPPSSAADRQRDRPTPADVVASGPAEPTTQAASREKSEWVPEQGANALAEFVPASLDVHPPLTRDEAAVERAARQGYRYGDKRASIIGVAILDHRGNGPVRELVTGRTYQFVLDCEANHDLEQLYAGFLVRDLKGDILFGSDTQIREPASLQLLSNVRAGERRRVIARIESWLAPGDYFMSAAVTAQEGRQSDMWFDAFEFRVVGPQTQHTNSRVFLDPQFMILPAPAGVAAEH